MGDAAGSADLDPEDRLALGIGRVARAHVEIDNALRRVHQSLASPGLAVYLVNRISTSALVADCRTMLAKAGLQREVADAANATFDAAAAANVTRNQVVHDMWLRDAEAEQDAPRWLTLRRAKGELNFKSPNPPRDLDFLDAALTEMKRANVRVSALNWALWEVLPFFQGSHGEGHDSESAGHLDEWIAVMEDRFTLLGDGSFAPHP